LSAVQPHGCICLALSMVTTLSFLFILFSLHAGLYVRLRRGLAGSQQATGSLEEVRLLSSQFVKHTSWADITAGPTCQRASPGILHILSRRRECRRCSPVESSMVGRVPSARVSPPSSSGPSQEHPAGCAWRPAGDELNTTPRRLGCSIGRGQVPAIDEWS